MHAEELSVKVFSIDNSPPGQFDIGPKTMNVSTGNPPSAYANPSLSVVAHVLDQSECESLSDLKVPIL